MTDIIKILQCNTDNLRFGIDYVGNIARNSDLIFLQRFPKKYKEQLQEITGNRAFMLESCPPHEQCLAIAKTGPKFNFDDTESIVLPSHEVVTTLGDAWQGCTALKTVVCGVNFINILPSYEVKIEEECIISDFYRKSDIEFVLNKYKDTPTVIVGDFHVKPNAESTNASLAKFGFESFIDDAKSFKPCADKESFNLDKCVSNIDITVGNIEVYNTVYTERGHYAITYDLVLPKLSEETNGT